MYPPSPFAVPTGSFLQPVTPPTTDPSTGPLFYIPVNCEWMPYVAGALQQLLLQTTWNCDADTLVLTQDRVFNLIALFNCMTAKTLEQLCPTNGGECGDCDMGCCIRFQNGVLQMLSCGEWVDVPGQPAGGIEAPSQPGVPIPPPEAGACKTYGARVGPSSPWLVPVLANTGDVFQVDAWSGATTDVAPLGRWNTPTGGFYIAGRDNGAPILDPSALNPSLPIGVPMYYVDGVYYDAQTAFTVPGGVTNQPIAVVINYAPGGDWGGELVGNIEYCNNQPGGWAISQDLTQNYGRWVASVDGFAGDESSWLFGQGWHNEVCVENTSHTAFYDIVYIDLFFDHPTTLTHIDMTYDASIGDLSDGGGNTITAYVSGTPTTLASTPSTTASNQTLAWSGSLANVDHLRILIYGADLTGGSCPTPGTAQLRAVNMSGVGVIPI